MSLGPGALARNAVARARGRLMPFALTYHGIGDPSGIEDPHGTLVPEAAFVAQVELVLRRGYRIVGITELWDAVARGEGDGLGAMTFDDGLADTLHTAARVLGERGGVATAFLAAGLLDGPHPDLPSHRILSADEVAPLEARGVEIGAHSHGHEDLLGLDDDALAVELARSRGALEALLGHPVTTMAYPYGRYDARVVAASRDAGFTVACANDGAGRWEALALPREAVFPATSLARLELKVAGLYGPVQALGGLRATARR